MRFRSSTLAAATLALALTACSDADEGRDDAEPRPESSASDQPSSAETSEDKASEETSSEEPSSDGAEPADGQEVATAALTLRLPSEVTWEVPPPVDRGGASLTQAAHLDGSEEWIVAVLEADPAVPRDELAAGSLQGAEAQYRRVKQRAERTIDGEPAFVVEARRPLDGSGARADDYYYEVGVSLPDHWVTVGFRAPEGGPETRAWIESTLASISWQ
jgi:hypothetical protein